MTKIWKSLNPIHQFWALGTWKVTQLRCLMSQETNGTDILTWIVLKLSFQYWSFLEKFQVCIWLFCAAGSSFGIGFAFIYVCEWLGQRKLIKDPWINEKYIWFSRHYFAIFFTCFWYKSCPIPLILSIFG